MALKKYNVIVNGLETILQLDESGAKARGLTDKHLVGARREESADLEALAAEQAAAEAAAAEEAAAKEAAEAAAKAEADKKAAAAANKSRTPANKAQ